MLPLLHALSLQTHFTNLQTMLTHLSWSSFASYLPVKGLFICLNTDAWALIFNFYYIFCLLIFKRSFISDFPSILRF